MFSFRPSSVLAIEVEEELVRAAVVTRKDGSFHVSNTVEVSRTGRGVDKFLNPEDLNQILEKMGDTHPKRAVVAAHDVYLIDLTLEARKVRKLNADQLAEALRWEAAPYTNIEAGEMLIGHEVGVKNEQNEFEIRVSVSNKDEYEQFMESLGNEGMKLQRLYPPDVCFAVASSYANGGGDVIAINVGSLLSRVVSVEGGKLVGNITVPYGRDAIRSVIDSGEASDEIEKSFADACRSVSGEATKIVVSGVGGETDTIVAYIKQCTGIHAVAYAPNQQGDLKEEGHNASAFAVAVGAALRELGYANYGNDIGVGDSTSFEEVFGEKGYYIPAMIAAGILLLMFLHNGYLGLAYSSLDSQCCDLVEERDSAQSTDTVVTALARDLHELERNEKMLRKRLEFQTVGAQGHILRMDEFLRGIVEQVPSNVSLNSIIQLQERSFHVAGKSASPDSVHLISTGLQNQSWCKTAKVIQLEQENSRGDSTNIYDFKLLVTLAECEAK